MDRYNHLPLPLPLPLRLSQQQQKELADSRRRKLSLEDDRRRSTTSKKMRLDKETEKANGSSNDNNNDSSNSISSQGQRSSRRSRSPRGGLDPLTFNAHKTPLPKLPPPRPKVVNWRLACFMAREYLCSGTLLGNPWPPKDSNTAPHEVAFPKPKPQPPQGEETVREQEGLYTTLTTDFLRSDDVHIPGVLNPSQLAAWLGLK